MNDLIKKAQEGNERSFEELYKLYYNEVFNTIFYIVKDTEIANDLTSDVFIKVYQNLSMYKEDISFKMWLKTIASNYCIDYIRKKKRSNEVYVDEYTIETESATYENALTNMINKDDIRIMYESIKKLKEPYKTIMHMRLDGKKYEDIAKDLSINLGTLKAYINFAKRKIQKYSEKLEQ